MSERNSIGRVSRHYLRWFLCVLALVCLVSTPTQAALLGLDSSLTNTPDLFSPNLSVAYTASTDLFVVTGDTSDYTQPDESGPFSITDGVGFPLTGPGTFSISATINDSGSLVSGTITIWGDVPDLSITPPAVLLQGTLTAFGYQAGASPLVDPDEFEFLFTVTGGNLAGDYGSVAGTLLHPGVTSFANIFTTDFSNDGFGNADTRMMIPEPSPVFLVMLSVLGLCWVGKRAPVSKC